MPDEIEETQEVETPVTDEVETETPTDEVEEEPTEGEQEDETFTAEYVQTLRDESAKYRTKAKDRDDLAARLHTSLVAATGRLADPSDLTFDTDHLTDPDALTAAVEALLTAKPHLASRKPTGDIGQGASVVDDTFSLSGLLRSNA